MTSRVIASRPPPVASRSPSWITARLRVSVPTLPSRTMTSTMGVGGDPGVVE